MKALKKRAATQKARPRRRLADQLLEVSNKIAVAANLDEAFDVLKQHTAAAINAEESSVFLNDPRTGELYTRIADGRFTREIRMLNNLGVAGHVFATGRGM